MNRTHSTAVLLFSRVTPPIPNHWIHTLVTPPSHPRDIAFISSEHGCDGPSHPSESPKSIFLTDSTLPLPSLHRREMLLLTSRESPPPLETNISCIGPPLDLLLHHTTFTFAHRKRRLAPAGSPHQAPPYACYRANAVVIMPQKLVARSLARPEQHATIVSRPQYARAQSSEMYLQQPPTRTTAIPCSSWAQIQL